MELDRRSMMGLGLAGAAAAAAPLAAAPASDAVKAREMDVWPQGPPGGQKVTVRQGVIERSKTPGLHDRAVIGITRPTLTVYQPANPDGSAVLIMPGGGYQRVVIDKEGEETARALAVHGITAAVLLYRLPGDGWEAGIDAPLQDAQRSLRLLRNGVAAGALDPSRIGVLGFSAGGHLAAAAATRQDVVYQPVDGADRGSVRPDFACLMYAAVGMRVPRPANGVQSAVPARPALTDAVTKTTTPCFLVHAADDPAVPVEDSLRMFAALKAAGVPAEMHIFQEGGHGFGVRMAAGKPAEVWPDLFARWGARANFFRRVAMAR